MKEIHHLLGISKEQHEAYLFELWRNWAESVAGNTRQWQKIMANKAIHNWFLMELANIEAEFRRKVERFVEADTITAVDCRKCFQACIADLFKVHPKPLIDQVLKDQFGKVKIICDNITVFTSLNLN